jgi:hypothetical protein
MPIPSEITILIESLNNKLNQLEQDVTVGLNLAIVTLKRFPENATLIQNICFFK